MSSKSALHRAVGVVPVVQDAQVVVGSLFDVQLVAGLARLLQSQQVVGAVKQSCVVAGCYHRLRALALDGVGVLCQALLPFQHHRSSLPVRLQLAHSRTLHARYAGRGFSLLHAQPQLAAVLTIHAAPSCHQQDQRRQ